MDLRNIDLTTKAQGVAEAAATELNEEQLSSVSGGKGNAKATASLMKGLRDRHALSRSHDYDPLRAPNSI